MPTAAPTLSPPLAVARDLPALRAGMATLRAEGAPVALVPTMGALHEGHLSLVRLAGRDGHRVAVSVFVNPTQFGPGEDLTAYPRREAADLELAAAAGAELAFCPPVDVVYPAGDRTTVAVGGPSEGLEGAARPHHFDGVATVVAKLLLMVRPDRLVLGQKDAQQVAVIRRMMRDLHLDDAELVVGPTVREPDGLAMSSRNAYLGPEDRAPATALVRALRAAEARALAGERDARALEATAMAVLGAEPRCAPDYAALVDPDDFRPLERLERPGVLCVAGRVGPARLIDNLVLVPAAGPTGA